MLLRMNSLCRRTGMLAAAAAVLLLAGSPVNAAGVEHIRRQDAAPGMSTFDPMASVSAATAVSPSAVVSGVLNPSTAAPATPTQTTAAPNPASSFEGAAAAPSATVPTPTNPATTSQSSSSDNKGAIIGGAVGGVVGGIVVGALIIVSTIFCIRMRRRRSQVRGQAWTQLTAKVGERRSSSSHTLAASDTSKTDMEKGVVDVRSASPSVSPHDSASRRASVRMNRGLQSQDSASIPPAPFQRPLSNVTSDSFANSNLITSPLPLPAEPTRPGPLRRDSSGYERIGFVPGGVAVPVEPRKSLRNSQHQPTAARSTRRSSVASPAPSLAARSVHGLIRNASVDEMTEITMSEVELRDAVLAVSGPVRAVSVSRQGGIVPHPDLRLSTSDRSLDLDSLEARRPAGAGLRDAAAARRASLDEIEASLDHDSLHPRHG